MNEYPKCTRRSTRQRIPTQCYIPHSYESNKTSEDVITGNKQTGKKRLIKNDTISHQLDKKQKCDVHSAVGQESKTKLEDIKALLRAIGDEPDNSHGRGNCVRAAIFRGFVKLTGKQSDMDQVVTTGVLPCGHEGKVTLRNLLNQPDSSNHRLNLDHKKTTVFCKKESCSCNGSREGQPETYVTHICLGTPKLVTSGHHNHCRTCNYFGICSSGGKRPGVGFGRRLFKFRLSSGPGPGHSNPSLEPS